MAQSKGRAIIDENTGMFYRNAQQEVQRKGEEEKRYGFHDVTTQNPEAPKEPPPVGNDPALRTKNHPLFEDSQKFEGQADSRNSANVLNNPDAEERHKIELQNRLTQDLKKKMNLSSNPTLTRGG